MLQLYHMREPYLVALLTLNASFALIDVIHEKGKGFYALMFVLNLFGMWLCTA